jgi:DNA adenine methylase
MCKGIAKPFLKWAGGKGQLLNKFEELYPQELIEGQIETYIEPFVGGGAVLFNVLQNYKIKKAYINDINKELINCYRCIKADVEEVIKQLEVLEKEYLISEDRTNYFYKVRDRYNEIHLNGQYDFEKCTDFIFLNKTCFNGLYRVNRQGRYNVPYGFRTNWTYSRDRIIQASEKLKNTNIVCGDFETNKYRIKPNDLVFLDPPYTVSHNHNGFIEYNQNLFSIEDQERLNKFINYIKRKGAYYILTNAAHEAILQIFDKDEDRTLELPRKSLIGGKNANRTEITEYIFTNLRGGAFDGQQNQMV